MVSSTALDASTRRERVGGRDAAWLLAAIGAGLVVYVVYLRTHPYPGFSAGLFVRMAAEIAANGYGLPTRIPGYTVDGVPFAYPPLPLYGLAALVDVGGMDPVAVSRFLPGIVVVATLPPYYGVARELLDSTTEAGLATVLLAVTPAVLRWHLSAGGVVRAPAFLFAVVGLYAGLKLFRTDDPRWLLPATVTFALTVLSHPTYATFLGASYLLFAYCFDRTVRGVALGAVVAVGGLMITAPWWLQVVSIHGVDVFTGAAGTHDGLGGGGVRIVSAFAAPLVPDAEMPFFLAAFAGGAYCLVRRRYLLPAWLLGVGYLLGKSRFLFVPGAMLIAILVVEWLLPRIRGASTGRPRRVGPRAGLVLVILIAGSLGTLYAAGGLAVWHDSPSLPAFVDDQDREAMRWVESNTAPEEEFVVLGDAAEWFPALADRTILVGHWGVEWEGAGAYSRQLSLYEHVSTCRTEACVTEAMAAADVEPAYVYVPKGHYTVRGVAYRAPPRLWQSFREADGYRLVYENDGVAVFRVTDGKEAVDQGSSSKGR